MSEYTPVIGLEIHIELKTSSKMFCGCCADHFGVKPNTQVCPVCLGLPGALPHPNKKAIEYTIAFGKALNCSINKTSKFDRKHYFYPDLPKGYQISQYDLPLTYNGIFDLPNNTIRIKRVHLEEDTGKLIHQTIDGERSTLIDFNRSGVALAEMVTEPDFSDVDQVIKFLKEIQLIVRYLKISNADMEKGSMRLEANISLRKSDTEKIPDYKVELKNINSFRFVEKALFYEIERQKKLLENNETPIQETRGFDQDKNITYSQRTKENANDYRYFPEPDIPIMNFDDIYLNNIIDNLLPLPNYYREKLRTEYNLHDNYIEIMVSNYEKIDFYLKALTLSVKHNIGSKIISDLIINKHFDEKFDDPYEFIKEIMKICKKEYADDDETQKAINNVLSKEIQAVEKYKEGKIQIFQFLIGMVQRELKGKGDYSIINKKLKESIK